MHEHPRLSLMPRSTPPWKSFVRSAIVLTATAMAAAGCSTTQIVVAPVTLPQDPLVARLPLAVGAYYAPQFRSYEHVEEWTGAARHRWSLLLGPASASLFEQTLPAMFGQVRPLAMPPGAAVGLDRLDAVVEPTIEDAQLTFGPALRTARFRIRYRLTLRSADGQTIASWTALGAAEDTHGVFELRPTVVARVVERALRAAAADLLVGFHQQPELARWPAEAPRTLPSLPAAPVPSAAGVTIIGAEPKDDGPFPECIATRIRADRPELKMIPTREFRDALFPWFEPHTAPHDAERFAAVLARPGIAGRLAMLDVRYMVLVSGGTTMDWKGGIGCGVAYQGGGCFGLKWADRSSTVAAVVWDTKRAGEAKFGAEVNTKWIIPALVVPIPLVVPTESTACWKAATLIEDYLQRMSSDVP